MTSEQAGAEAFDDADVARAYAFRPPYPRALYEFVADLPRQRRRALDLGCGTGKIAHGLAARFAQVDAVDPSLPMLQVADDGAHPNVTWIQSTAEAVRLSPPYDLVTAGASIHWMDHARLFPRLAGMLDDDGVIVVIEGDEAHDAPWRADWESFLRRWLERLGRQYDPSAYLASMSAFRAWMTVAGERTFQAQFSQSIEHFVECQHSRATWSRARLGPEHSAAFDAELRDLLLPHATDGMLSYTVETQLVWGTPSDR